MVCAGGLIDEVLPGTGRMSSIQSMRRMAEVNVSVALPAHGDPLTTEPVQQIIELCCDAAHQVADASGEVLVGAGAWATRAVTCWRTVN